MRNILYTGDLAGHGTATEQAEARTEQADARTKQADVRTEQADARTKQADVRTERADARTEQADARTLQAETRTELAEARAGLAEIRAEQAETSLHLAVHQEIDARQDISTRVNENPASNDSAKPTSPLGQLTGRQRKILQLIAEGQNTKTIAELLQVSPKTIEYHRVKLMDRLDLHDIPNLVRYALRVGLIPPENSDLQPHLHAP